MKFGKNSQLRQIHELNHNLHSYDNNLEKSGHGNQIFNFPMRPTLLIHRTHSDCGCRSVACDANSNKTLYFDNIIHLGSFIC